MINSQGIPKAKKSLGQNFLLDSTVLDKIVSFIPEKYTDLVFEIGTGTGALTIHLAKRFKRVITIEKDDRLIDWHEQEGLLPDNCLLIHEDALSISIKNLKERFHANDVVIVGNLPYNIASRLLVNICDDSSHVSFCAFLFQQEVAKRIIANPGTKDYGFLSVISGYCFSPKIAMTLSPGLFHPRPKVYSSLVLFEHANLKERAKDYNLFKNVVKTAFSKRRKKILNSLSALGIKKSMLTDALEKAEIDPTLRAENITISGFIRLSNELFKLYFREKEETNVV